MIPAHALIDLDGTLTDPKPGIVGSVQRVLADFGLPVPAFEDMLWVIGPPTRRSFPTLGVPPDRVEEAVARYRAYYRDGAMFDAPVYDGIPEALDTLRAAGLRLVVATSKPHAFARPILDHFDLTRRFDAVYGAELDGRNDDKGDLLEMLIAREGVDTSRAVMIGDRLFDVRAAQRHGLPSIGVLWGYGGRVELSEAGASHLCERPADLPALVRTAIHGNREDAR